MTDGEKKTVKAKKASQANRPAKAENKLLNLFFGRPRKSK